MDIETLIHQLNNAVEGVQSSIENLRSRHMNGDIDTEQFKIQERTLLTRKRTLQAVLDAASGDIDPLIELTVSGFK